MSSMNGHRPRPSGKHHKGHGKPKKKVARQKLVLPPPAPRPKWPTFEPKTDVERWVKFAMMLEAMGYNIDPPDYED